MMPEVRRFPRGIVLAGALACAFLFLPRDALAQARVSVLCYHAFRDAPLKKDPYSFSLEQLASHIAGLKKQGIRFVSVGDLLAGRVTGSNNVLVSVDDGHRSVYDAYRKVFRPNGIRPLLAIYPNVIGKKEYALTWGQLAELAAAGCDVAAHGYYHLRINRKLSEENPRGFRREINGSKKKLEEKLGRRIAVFVYPYGVRSEITIRALKEAGYRCAFTIDRGPVAAPVMPGNGAFELSRYMVTRGNWNYCYNRVLQNSRIVATAAPVTERRIARAPRRSETIPRPERVKALQSRLTETASKKTERTAKTVKRKGERADISLEKKDGARDSMVAVAARPRRMLVREVPSRRNIEPPPLPLSRDAVTVAAPVQRVATNVKRDNLVEEWGGMSAVAAPLYEPGSDDDTRREAVSREHALAGAPEFSAPAPPDRMKRDYRDIRRRSLRTYRDVIEAVREKIDGIRRAIRNYAVKNW
ncbi:MAG: polysaccharide deacetylase family protein [Spirochaetes bacterium]|nr:polysaccharide deacetylase family protein [Spirochaetota bacterium]